MNDKKHTRAVEEAAIRLAANAYIERQGEQIVKEAESLNQENQISDEQMKEFDKFCKKQFAKKEVKSKIKQMSKVSIALLAVVVFVSGIMQFSMTYDVAKENKVTKYTGDTKLKYAPSYIPESFKREKITFKRQDNVKIIYGNKTGELIHFSYNTSKNDINEKDISSYVNINGSVARIIKKKSENVMTIIWEKGEYTLSVKAKGIKEEEVIKIAQSVKSVE